MTRPFPCAALDLQAVDVRSEESVVRFVRD